MTVWRKSSFSGGGDVGGGNCVEVAALPGGRTAFRDSKNPGSELVVSGSWLEAIRRARPVIG
jgi:hypothetical protein